MKWRWRRTIIAVALIVGFIYLFPTVVVTVIFGTAALKERLTRTGFDSARWVAGVPDGVRGRMIDDLLRRHALEGKTQIEVIRLIGEPDANDRWKAKERFPDWNLHYYLGPSRRTVLFSGFNYDYLVLRLDENNRVTGLKIVTVKT